MLLFAPLSHVLIGSSKQEADLTCSLIRHSMLLVSSEKSSPPCYCRFLTNHCFLHCIQKHVSGGAFRNPSLQMLFDLNLKSHQHLSQLTLTIDIINNVCIDFFPCKEASAWTLFNVNCVQLQFSQHHGFIRINSTESRNMSLLTSRSVGGPAAMHNKETSAAD
jgi:hypothetical protein